MVSESPCKQGLLQKETGHPLRYALYQNWCPVLVREAGVEPARPEWTLEPESSESANSTTRAYVLLDCSDNISYRCTLVNPFFISCRIFSKKAGTTVVEPARLSNDREAADGTDRQVCTILSVPARDCHGLQRKPRNDIGGSSCTRLMAASALHLNCAKHTTLIRYSQFTVHYSLKKQIATGDKSPSQ